MNEKKKKRFVISSEKEFVNHEQIMSMTFSLDDGIVYAFTRDKPMENQKPFIVFGERIAPVYELLQLLTSAPLIYQCLISQLTLIESFIADLNSLPPEPHRDRFRTLLENVLKLGKTTQQYVIKGTDGLPGELASDENAN
jgi:hypothetical protein